MPTFYIAICLLGAQPADEPAQQAEQLYGEVPVSARLAYQRLQTLTMSSDPKLVDGAKLLLTDYERRRESFLKSVGIKNMSSNYFGIKTDEPIDPKDMCYFYNLKSLSIIGTNAKHFGDQHLARLSGMKGLTAIDIEGTSLTGKNLPDLNFPDLGVLHLHNVPVTDEIVCALDLPSMELLDVGGSKVTNQMLANCRMTQLRCLRCENTAITADGFKSLARFKELSELIMDIKMFDPVLLEIVKDEKLPLKRLSLCYKDPAEIEQVQRIRKLALEIKVRSFPFANDP